MPKVKGKSGRNPKLNPKTHCVMVRFDDSEWNDFLSMFEKSGVYARSVFLKAHFFGQPFKVLKVDKTLVTTTPSCRISCAVPRRGYELQPSREGTEAAFFREKGDGVALQAGATHRRTRETEPSDCGIVERNGSKMVAKISVGNSLYGAIAYGLSGLICKLDA